MDTPYQLREENHPLHKHATALVDDLFDAGLAGGKRSHKGQYVRWMLGRVRGDREGDPVPGDEAYKRPYAKDPTRFPLAVSNPINSRYAGWSPDDWEGKFDPFNPSMISEPKRSKFVKAMISKNGITRTVKVKKAPAQKNEIIDTAPARSMGIDELIIHIFTTQKPEPTTREIVKIAKEKYGRDTSQPTVARRLKAYREGKIDATGKAIKTGSGKGDIPNIKSLPVDMRKSMTEKLAGMEVQHYKIGDKVELASPIQDILKYVDKADSERFWGKQYDTASAFLRDVANYVKEKAITVSLKDGERKVILDGDWGKVF